MIPITEKILQERKDLIQTAIDKNVFSEIQIQIILCLAEFVAIEYAKEQTDGIKNLMTEVLREMGIEG